MGVSMTTPGLLESIENRVATPHPECLIWLDATDRGYGRIYVDGTAKRVHRVVWELKFGPIPDGLTIDHLCRIRSCANTDHMELVPLSENVRRENRFRRRGMTDDTHCLNGHEYTPENTAQRRAPNGAVWRKCKTCNRAAKARLRTKRAR